VPDGVRFLRTTDINENGELQPDGVFIRRERRIHTTSATVDRIGR
jgi:hypothetical protein